MKKTLFLISILVVLLVMACGDMNTTKDAAEETTESAVADTSNIVTLSLNDEDGNSIDLLFDYNKDVVILKYLGAEEILTSQKPASGMWYANENYEMSGKGNDLTLTKNGKVIYEHKDEMLIQQARNDKGNVLHMVFNNTTGKVQVYLDGGDQIELTTMNATSGILFANEHYELSGKDGHYKLTKEGTVIFEN